MRSLLGKTTLFFFGTTAIVVIIFSLVINYQITEHFSQYLNMYHGQGMHGMGTGMGRGMMMGFHEQEFLVSLRYSLAVTAGIMLLIGAAASCYFARGIAMPVIGLNKAVKSVTEGNLDIKVTASSDDEVGQLAGAFNDMTAKLQTNNILRQRFLAGVAHELRTPLTILRANLEGMIDGVITKDEEQLNSLNEEVSRLTKIVEDLRDLSLIEVGQLRLEFDETDINNILRDVANKLKPLADSKKISLTIRLDSIPVILADGARVGQMIYNLAINALHYTPSGGRIILSSSVAAEHIKIGVTDNGMGIGAEHLEHIFDHFYRVDASRTKQSGGTGLGLAVVKQIAVAHGGQVMVESEIGCGSTFTVLLPFKTKNT